MFEHTSEIWIDQDGEIYDAEVHGSVKYVRADIAIYGGAAGEGKPRGINNVYMPYASRIKQENATSMGQNITN